MNSQLSRPWLQGVTRPSGRAVRGASGVLVAAGVVWLTGIAGPAAAADYRYWTLWGGTSGGEWQPAITGAADIAMTDTAVVGWHFTVAPADGGTRPPDFGADFTALCPEFTAPVEGQHRVAVVVDTGSPDVAPAGEQPPPARVGCVSVDIGQSALDATVLAVTDVRAEGGLICGLDGYPAVECGTLVETTTPDATTPDATTPDATTPETPGSRAVSPWPWVIGAVVIATSVLLLVLSLAQRARRRQ